MKITSVEKLYEVYSLDWINHALEHERVLDAEYFRQVMNVLRDVHGMPNPENFWRWREVLRLYTNEYSQIPTKIYSPWVSRFIDTFEHVSLINNLQIAYTPDEDYGKRDIQVSIKFGKFLRARYTPDQMSDKEVRDYANAYTLYFQPPDIKFATTREEIKRVYDGGPSSCMKCKRVDGIAPTEVYAGPDTAVAYVGDIDAVTSRSVVVPSKKHYIRIYGDDSYLYRALSDMGYTHGTLKGLRLLKLHDEHDRLIMPYLDGDQGCFVTSHYVVVCESDDEDCEYICDQQHGYPREYEPPEENPRYCPDCQETYPEEAQGDYVGDEWICQGCLDENYYYAYVSGYEHEWVHPDNEPVYEFEGDYYTEDALDAFGLVLVDYDVHRESDTTLSVVSGDRILLSSAIYFYAKGYDEGYIEVTDISELMSQGLPLYVDFENVAIKLGDDIDVDGEFYAVEDLISMFPTVERRYDTLPYPQSRICSHSTGLYNAIPFIIAEELERIGRDFSRSTYSFCCQPSASQSVSDVRI